MGAQYQHGQEGFTIVETLMFMAISGLLAATLLGGWTVMINNQRYKDSVHSLQSFLQQQYNLVYNVENGRSTDVTCTYSPATGYKFDDTTVLNQTPRGQSGCVVMGRYLSIDVGRVVKVNNIVGIDQEDEKAKPTYVEPNSDIESIQQYHPGKVSSTAGLSNAELEIPWQATVFAAGDALHQPKSYVIAIIRAPLTGTVHTYTSTVDTDVTNIVSGINERNDITLCLNPDAPLTGGGQGVVIKKFASSQSSIETTADGVCS